MLIFLVVMCVLFGGALFFIFTSGFLSGESDGWSWSASRPPRLRELPSGCLVTLIVFGALWFIAWGIVLILAINLLRTPLD
ncbi:MAG: hypothetical protein ACRD0S_00905 [Acidimicrobiales bacterium]